MLKNFTLELSSKPFRDESEATMYSVCRHLFRQWSPMLQDCDCVSVMLWTADGSEILEYDGNLSSTFEWAYWCGCANHCPAPENPNPYQLRDTHKFPYKYIDEAAPRPYSWLKRLIEVIRETGLAITGKPIRVGATYDNGPEFAISDFKFNRHKEIAQGHTLYPNSFVTCTSVLHGDSRPYAAFPEGIPEGTSIGTFLGAQFKRFAEDMGYDYLWLSNGMGFGTETWRTTGMLFDNERFYPEKRQAAVDLMSGFWDDFFAAYPDCKVETRGSNFSAGLEMATDGAPLKELYDADRIVAPVNPPWAALNFNVGVEIVAWMSHIAELPPNHRIPFRFYIHDPWFMNSPWLDRYGRDPWDIYLPMSVSRLTGEGKPESADSISLLSADDTWGGLPDQVPNEVIPHLQEALRHASDKCGPFLWVYPFDEYSSSAKSCIANTFNEEIFIGDCIQNCFPLNTVISTGNFRRAMSRGVTTMEEAILLLPVTAAECCLDELEGFLKRGGKAVVYGALSRASQRLCAILGIDNAPEALTGTGRLLVPGTPDRCECGAFSDAIHIISQFADGGLTEIPAEDAYLQVLAEAEINGERRLAASLRRLPEGGSIAFMRSIHPIKDYVNVHVRADYTQVAPTVVMARMIIAELGWKIALHCFKPNAILPQLTVGRCRNAFYFSVHAQDTSVEMRMNTPYGAPILTEMETRLDADGNAVWHPARCWHKECRCFVKQDTPAVISSKIYHQSYPDYARFDRRVYEGFSNAEVRFFVPEGFCGELEVVCTPPGEETVFEPFNMDTLKLVTEWEETAAGKCAVLRNVSGALAFNLRAVNTEVPNFRECRRI